MITNEGIAQEARGKSLDTRMSKETFEELEDFANHPKFEYDGIMHKKMPKTRRNKDKMKESIHKSTSPAMNRNNTVKNMNLNYVSSNKVGQNITYLPKDTTEEQIVNPNSRIQKEVRFQKDSLLKKNMSNFPSSKNHRSMLKLHEKGLKKVSGFFERDKSASNLGVKNQFNLDKTENKINEL